MADFIKARAHLKAASRRLLNAIDLADDLRRTLAQAEPERNFCPRCGKRLADEGIHTCTPPQTKCDHCSSPLFAAVQCRVCGRKEAK